MNKVNLPSRHTQTVLDLVRATISAEDLKHVKIKDVAGKNDTRYSDKCGGIQLSPMNYNYGANSFRRVMIKWEKGANEWAAKELYLERDDLAVKVAEMVKLSKEHVEYTERSRVQSEQTAERKERVMREMNLTEDSWRPENKSKTPVRRLHTYEDGTVDVQLDFSLRGSAAEVRQTLDKLEQLGVIKKVD